MIFQENSIGVLNSNIFQELKFSPCIKLFLDYRSSSDNHIINVTEGLLHRFQARYPIPITQGEGAYSVVYKVERQTDKKVYALKKVKLANLSDKEIENALNEVRILASIKNPNIIGYKEVFLEGKSLW